MQKPIGCGLSGDKGEPLPKQPAPKAEAGRDPRTLFERESIASIDDVRVGDFITCSWSRPRRVELIDAQQSGRVLVLAEPDPDRQDGHRNRVVDADEWERRGAWSRFPGLRAVWDAAEGA